MAESTVVVKKGIYAQIELGGYLLKKKPSVRGYRNNVRKLLVLDFSYFSSILLQDR